MHYLTCLILVLLFTFFRGEASLPDGDQKEREQVTVLALTFQAFERPERDKVWPNFQLSRLPTIVHFTNGHLYAFQFKGSAQLWTPQLIQRYPVLFCPQHPTSLTQVKLHPSFLVENQRAFIFGLDSERAGDDLSLFTFVHERFHLHQFKHFAKVRSKEEYEDRYHEENLVLMEIEHRLLTRFLKETDAHGKEEQLKNYLAVSSKRRELLASPSLAWEEHQQRMEGLADYVSLKTYCVFPLLSAYEPEALLLHMREKKTKGLTSLSQDAIKGRHYFVGATLGFALDFCHVLDWKQQVERGKASLQQLLEKALPLAHEDKQARLAAMQVQEGIEAIRQTVVRRLDEEKKQFEKLVQAFHESEGIIVGVRLPKQSTSGGGSNQSIHHFASLKMSVQESSYAVSQDQRWKLTLISIPFVLEHASGERLFKLKEQAVLYVDGEKLALKAILQSSQPLSFKSLLWKEANSELDCMLSGRLYVRKEGLLIDFD